MNDDAEDSMWNMAPRRRAQGALYIEGLDFETIGGRCPDCNLVNILLRIANSVAHSAMSYRPGM